jgi:hypothetical protein
VNMHLQQPSMAINDARSPRRFQMWTTWDITANESRETIIRKIAATAHNAIGGRLKNLVINCHGRPGMMLLGQGFDARYTGLFWGLQGLVDQIVLTGCMTANKEFKSLPPPKDPNLHMSNGHIFCSTIAKLTGAYVIASSSFQYDYDKTFPMGEVTELDGIVLCYDTKGKVKWTKVNPEDQDD